MLCARFCSHWRARLSVVKNDTMVRATEQTVILGVLVFAGILAFRHYRQKGTNKQATKESRTAASLETAVPKKPSEEAAGISDLKGNEALFNKEELNLVQQLLEHDQGHLFAHWPPPGNGDREKCKLVQQLLHLNGSYNGGLAAYIQNAKQLLEDSREGRNPFEGYIPEVPDGEKLDFGSDSFIDYERQGVEAAGRAAFVLVAGGLGERLGYSGIKLALPVDSASNKCFLQVYIESILALQRKPGKAQDEAVKLELVIMTSDDTHSRTQALLDEHDYFGMERDQLHLLKQEKVACLTDSAAHLALEQHDPYKVQRKPHGHGDVHALLHSTGLVKKWQQNGVQWVCFFQDTNGLVFRALPAALGVSSKYGYDVNSLAVPRKAKEAIGGIARLRHQDGRCMTINVEYNQLDPLLRATGDGQGDVNNEDGWSPYPGNINQLILKVDSYVQSLEETQGIIAEFVNPKYKDASKTEFKSSTRLECMMQDYPKALPPSAAVGFTVVHQVWSTYSPVKNNPADALAKVEAGGPSHSATSGELDIYQVNCRALQMLGADVQGPQQATFNGLHLDFYPRVIWSPFFAMTVDDIKVHLDQNAVLYINHDDVEVRTLNLKGAIVVDEQQNGRVVLDNLNIDNKGWEWRAIEPTDQAEEHQKIRGFTVVRLETEQVSSSKPGTSQGSKHSEPDTRQAQAEEDPKPNSKTDSADDTKVNESKSSSPTRSSQGDQDHRSEGNRTVLNTSTQSGSEDSSQQQQESSDASVVRDLVHSIMTKAAAEAKGAAAETKEAEKLAASAAKSPKPKDEVALKKGTTGAAKGTEETPGHVVPDTAEAGDKHARTEAQPSGSPTKGAKKPKTDAAEAGKDPTAENGAAKGLESAVANSSAKPSSPKKGATAASKEPEAVPEVKTNPGSPKKVAPGSPKKGASSPKKGAIAEKVEAAVPDANKA